jgi:hypothetical protein
MKYMSHDRHYLVSNITARYSVRISTRKQVILTAAFRVSSAVEDWDIKLK